MGRKRPSFALNLEADATTAMYRYIYAYIMARTSGVVRSIHIYISSDVTGLEDD
jgi:hypothetical protein